MPETPLDERRRAYCSDKRVTILDMAFRTMSILDRGCFGVFHLLNLQAAEDLPVDQGRDRFLVGPTQRHAVT